MGSPLMKVVMVSAEDVQPIRFHLPGCLCKTNDAVPEDLVVDMRCVTAYRVRLPEEGAHE
jgi:hypothetical protein